jgi:hypothetical protein
VQRQLHLRATGKHRVELRRPMNNATNNALKFLAGIVGAAVAIAGLAMADPAATAAGSMNAHLCAVVEQVNNSN